MICRIDHVYTYESKKDNKRYTAYQVSYETEQTDNSQGWCHWVQGVVNGRVMSDIRVEGEPEFAPDDIVEAITEVHNFGGLASVRIVGFAPAN